MKRAERITLPLKGYTPIQGNIRVIIKDKIIDLHYTASLKKPVLHDHHELVGIDLGYTEVLTDHLGNCYGEGFGGKACII